MRSSSEIITEAQAMENTLKETRIRVEESTRRITDKRASLSTLYENINSNDLETRLLTFDDSFNKRTSEINILNHKISTHQSDINHLRSQADEVNIQKGQAENFKQLLDNEIKKLKDESNSIVNQCSLNPVLVPSTWSPTSTKPLIQAIEQKIEKSQKENELFLTEKRTEIKKIETEYIDVQKQVQSIEIDVSTKTFEYSKLCTDLSTQKIELSSLITAKSSFTSVQTDYLESQRNHDEFMNNFATRTSDLKKMLKVRINFVFHDILILNTTVFLYYDYSYNKD